MFAAVGAGFIVFSFYPTVRDWQAMQDWQQVPAEILVTELEYHRSDDSTTYNVTARYRYTFNGRTYISTRVGHSEGSDNIGDWHERWYDVLNEARLAGTPVPVWVNPAAPEEAIIDRDPRWGLMGFMMIFVVLFGGAGLAMIWFGARLKPDSAGLPQGRLLRMLRNGRTRPGQTVPDQAAEDVAWQSVAEWRNNRINSDNPAQATVLMVVAIIILLVTSPSWFLLPSELADGNYGAAFSLLFPVIALGILIYAIRKKMELRRFGPGVIIMDPFPGAAGGKVAGSLMLRVRYQSGLRINAKLVCKHVSVSGSGRNRRRRERVLWQDDRPVELAPSREGIEVRFAFDPPANLPGAGKPDSDYHAWTLHLGAVLDGVDLDRTYSLPVKGGTVTAAATSAISDNPDVAHGYEVASVTRVRGGERSGLARLLLAVLAISAVVYVFRDALLQLWRQIGGG